MNIRDWHQKMKKRTGGTGPSPEARPRLEVRCPWCHLVQYDFKLEKYLLAGGMTQVQIDSSDFVASRVQCCDSPKCLARDAENRLGGRTYKEIG